MYTRTGRAPKRGTATLLTHLGARFRCLCGEKVFTYLGNDEYECGACGSGYQVTRG